MEARTRETAAPNTAPRIPATRSIDRAAARALARLASARLKTSYSKTKKLQKKCKSKRQNPLKNKKFISIVQN